MLSYRKLKPETNLCNGTRPGHQIICNGTMYKCTACGAVGCRQTYENRCSGQAFDVKFRCLKCGEVGKQEALTG